MLLAPQPESTGVEMSHRTAWYQEAYLREKLQDEVYRSTRYNVPMSVVVAQFPAFSRSTARALHDFVGTHLRRLDFAGTFGDSEYALILPHTPRSGAQVVAQRLAETLSTYRPIVGFASTPEDSDNSFGLLDAAREFALQHRTDEIPSPQHTQSRAHSLVAILKCRFLLRKIASH